MGVAARVPVVWAPYGGIGAVLLAVVLGGIGATLILLGSGMTDEIRIPSIEYPGSVLVAAGWITSLLILIRTWIMLYRSALERTPSPILPVTLTLGVCNFVLIATIRRHDKLFSTIGAAFIGAAVGAAVFELPFDVIVGYRIPAPTTVLVGFFAPLFTLGLATLALLGLPRRIAITKYAVYLFGLMFLVLALWALDGFSYPTHRIAFLLNSVAKILSFATVAALFFGSDSPLRLAGPPVI